MTHWNFRKRGVVECRLTCSGKDGVFVFVFLVKWEGVFGGGSSGVV